MLGSISVSCFVSAWPVMVKVFAARDAWTWGLVKWITIPWFVNIFTSSIPEILFTPNFFKENWSFLSSAVAVLWTTFFFLQAVPFPPMLTCACNLASFSWFMIASFIWGSCPRVPQGGGGRDAATWPDLAPESQPEWVRPCRIAFLSSALSLPVSLLPGTSRPCSRPPPTPASRSFLYLVGAFIKIFASHNRTKIPTRYL